MEVLAAVFVFAVLALWGCGDAGLVGEVAGPAGTRGPTAGSADVTSDGGAQRAAQSSASAEVRFDCDEGASAEPEPLRRLTMTQYSNTVRDLSRWALGDPLEAERVVRMAELDRLPIDRREPTPRNPHGGYRRLDQALDQTHVDETLRVATTLASALTEPSRLGRVVGECAVDGDPDNDEACLTDFVRSFGARALRRPLDAEDERFYRAVYGTDPAATAVAYAELITVLLSAPEFLYLMESGEAELPGQPGSHVLSPHEFASRLSYHLWQTLPDDALWQAAEDGSLLQPEVLEQQVERLLADERAHTTMAELFGDLLELEELPVLDVHVDDPLYAAFAGRDLPGPELRQHVIDDALDMLAYYTWTAPGGVEQLFTNELSFARGEDLARIYGVEPWDGRSSPPALPAGERAGLHTRAWLLAGASASTRPIMRGVLLRRQLLCDELAPPPANVNAVPPPLRSSATTRQVVEELTEQPGTPCAACHATLINPLGFSLEGFDALGRVRTEQPLFSDDGGSLGSLPVDTRSVPRVTQNDDRVSTGPDDLARWMLDSGKLEACLARHYFRFTFGRYEDPARDGCALERLRSRLVESGRIREMLREAALLPEFRQRSFEAAP